MNEYVQVQPMMPEEYQRNVGAYPFAQQPTTPNMNLQNFQEFIPHMSNIQFEF